MVVVVVVVVVVGICFCVLFYFLRVNVPFLWNEDNKTKSEINQIDKVIAIILKIS